jgi:hypothetical protein
MGTSASDYKARYDQLRVFGSGGHSTTVSVHQYLMSGTGGMPGGGSATAWAALSQALNTKFGSGHSAKKIEDVDLMVGPLHDLEAVDPDFTATPKFRYLLLLPFVGKGAPEHCQLVLQLVQYFKLAADLQKYADENIGLDCNGWSGNYIRHGWGIAGTARPWTDDGIQHADGTNPETLVKQFLDGNQSRRIQKWNDLKPNTLYVLVRTDPLGHVITANQGADIGHVLVSDVATAALPADSTGHVPLRIVEATGTHNPPKGPNQRFGGGLVASTYSWVAEKQAGTPRAYFQIDRGTDYWKHRVLWFAIAGVAAG